MADSGIGQALMALDNTNSYLWVTFYRNSQLGYFEIKADGTLEFKGNVNILDGNDKKVVPFGITCDPAGAFVWTTCFFEDATASMVMKYHARNDHSGTNNISIGDKAWDAPVPIERPTDYMNGGLGSVIYNNDALWIAINDPKDPRDLPGADPYYYVVKCKASDGAVQGYVPVGHNPVHLIEAYNYIWVANSSTNTVMRIPVGAAFAPDASGVNKYQIPASDIFYLMDQSYPQRKSVNGVSFLIPDGNNGIWASVGGGGNDPDPSEPDIPRNNAVAHIRPDAVRPDPVVTLYTMPLNIQPRGLAIDPITDSFCLADGRNGRIIDLQKAEPKIRYRNEGNKPFHMIYDQTHRCIWVSDLAAINNQQVICIKPQWTAFDNNVTRIST